MSSSQPAPERKPRAVLDRLSADEQKLLCDYMATHTLADGVSWLAKLHNVEISDSSLSEWLAGRRKAERQAAFEEWLAGIKLNEQEALRASQGLSSSLGLADAATKTIAVGLFEAQRKGDDKSVAKLGQLVAFLLDAVSKAKRADAALEVAALARRRFEFDAAKAALEHVEKLQLVAASGGAEAEKIRTVTEILFGRPPEAVEAVSAEA